MRRLSREKIHRLAEIVVDVLQKHPGVTVRRDLRQLRWDVFTWIDQILQMDEEIDARVREKLRRAYRHVPEGGSEWQILYRRLYDEELQGLGKYRR
ncbi:MAG: DUF507 family protein [Acidobacteria bacterium]|nr:DUF507 family protein [Acidobacteriota bacterium]MDW7985564.1 DUF507 family protein [Acidobacteriota bacterium]